MANTPAHAITLPMQPTPRPRGMLLDVAHDLDAALFVAAGADRTGNGAGWLPWGHIIIRGESQTCATVYAKDPRALPAVAEQPAFMLWDSLTCSTLGALMGEMDRRVRVNMNDFVSAKIADELVTAALSGGLGLKGNGTTYVPTVISNTAVSLAQGMDALQRSLNAKQAGARFVIHLTSGLLDIAVALGLAALVGDHFETPSGHLVVGDAGFTGRDAQRPLNQPDAAADEAWIYGSSEIYYRTTALKPTAPVGVAESGNDNVYILQNKDRPLAERTGLVLFDPNLLAAALVDIGF